MVTLATHSMKRRIDWQCKEETTNTLYIQEAGAKSGFQLG